MKKNKPQKKQKTFVTYMKRQKTNILKMQKALTTQ